MQIVVKFKSMPQQKYLKSRKLFQIILCVAMHATFALNSVHSLFKFMKTTSSLLVLTCVLL